MAEKSTATRKRAPAKQQMLEALAETEKQVQEKREAQARPEQRIEQRIAEQAVTTADALSTEGIVKSISELRSAVAKTLAQLSDRLEEEVGKYVQVKRAILEKETELKEIYEIQKSATTLAALIETQQRMRDEFERDMASERERLMREIESTRAGWQQEEKEHDAQIKERDSAETKRRDREREEYRYSFAREQQLAKDQFADEMAKAHKELAEKTAEADRALAERERAIATRETELNTLRQRVEAFPAERDAAIAQAVKEITSRLQNESVSNQELLKREFAGERNVLTTRIAALEQTVKEQNQQLAKLAQQSEKAYTQVQEIAVRAIEGSSNFKSLTSLQQLFSEPARRPQAEK